MRTTLCVSATIVALAMITQSARAADDQPITVEQAEAKYQTAVREAGAELLNAKIAAKEAEKQATAKSRFELLKRARTEKNADVRKALMAEADRLAEKVKVVDLEIADLKKDQRAVRGWEVPQPNAVEADVEEEVDAPNPAAIKWHHLVSIGEGRLWNRTVEYLENGATTAPYQVKWQLVRGNLAVVADNGKTVVFKPTLIKGYQGTDRLGRPSLIIPSIE